MYNIVIRKKAEKLLDKAPFNDFEKITRTILELAETPYPYGVEKLINNIYRIRIGRYRIIYMVIEETKTIDIGKIDKRRERTYKEIKKIF